MKRRYDVGIIPCTSKKNPNGQTPLTLYKGVSFSMMMRHAQQRCDVILIMSAKYGLIGLDEPIRWYEAYLPNLPEEDRKILLAKLREQAIAKLLGKKVLWYPSKVYWETLLEAFPRIAENIRRPYRKLGNLRLYKVLSNEIKNYDTLPARR